MSPVRTPDRRRNTRVSSLLLFGVMASYSLLETARDALFLTRLPASKLPWAYLLTAALVSLTALLPSEAPSRSRTSGFLIAIAGAVMGLYLFQPWLGPYVFYAGVNLVGTLMLVSAWTLVGAQFTVGEARRAFAWIAAGGALGTTAGAAFATRIVTRHGALSLAALAGIGIALVSVTPFWLRPPQEVTRVRKAAPIRSMARAQYARRILFLVALTAIATTVGDLVFKSVVVETHAPSQLGPFFARYQLAMSGLALAAQLVFAPMLLRRVSANRVVLIFPALLGSAAVGLAILPGLGASLVLKGIDAALRNSLYRTSNEVLYLPLPVEVRSRLKAIVDGVGQRAAQALASLLTLGGLAIGAGRVHFAIVTAVAAFGALLTAFVLRLQYVKAFRDQVVEGKLDPHTPVPQLDLASTESLVTMLSSPNDARVLAAVDTLAAQRKTRLIPSLLLYHPSAKVAAHALELLSVSRRKDFLPPTERLLGHSELAMRALASRVRAEKISDPREWRRLADDVRPEVQVAGLVALVRAGVAKPAEDKRLEHLARKSEVTLALLEAIAHMPHERLLPLVERVAESETIEQRVAVARAFQAVGDPRALTFALQLLAVRQARDEARKIFLKAGARAVDFLAGALGDATVDSEIRRHIPRTLSRFANERAAGVLLLALAQRQGNGATRYKILRGLGRMRHDQPRLKLDKKILERLATDTLERARTLRRWRKSLESSSARSGLLGRLIARKEEMALERLFRFLDLLRPGEEMDRVFDGLSSNELALRSSSRELLEYLIPRGLREDVLALVDDRLHDRPLKLREALLEMLEDHSAALRRLAQEWVHASTNKREEVRHASS